MNISGNRYFLSLAWFVHTAYSRGAVVGKTGKTAVLPRFCGIGRIGWGRCGVQSDEPLVIQWSHLPKIVDGAPEYMYVPL